MGMRKLFTLLWLLFPVPVLCYHFSAGENQMQRVKARRHLAAIHRMEQAQNPDPARILDEYEQLGKELPGNIEPLVRHQIGLAKARIRLEMLDVAGAIEDLTAMLRDAVQEHGEDAAITRAIRETQGKAYYYATCLLKDSGAAESEWRPFAERARQIFRFLAERQDPAALASYEERVAAEFRRSANR